MTVDRQSFYNNDSTIDRLVAKVLRKDEANPPSRRVLIAISGIPGSGKSTLARTVAERLQAAKGDELSVIVVPMDGFHLYRSQLAAFPPSANAIHRRGAAFTFAADRFHKLVQDVSAPVTDSTPTIYAPSFDHAIKDPVEDDIAVPRDARVVIFEGLYLSLDREPWRSAAALMDELWFLHVDKEVGRQRLVKRHVASGIVPDEAAAEDRVATTDMLNADDILDNRLTVHEIITT